MSAMEEQVAIHWDTLVPNPSANDRPPSCDTPPIEVEDVPAEAEPAARDDDGEEERLAESHPFRRRLRGGMNLIITAFGSVCIMVVKVVLRSQTRC